MPELGTILSTFCASLSDPDFHRPMPEAVAIPDASTNTPSPEAP